MSRHNTQLLRHGHTLQRLTIYVAYLPEFVRFHSLHDELLLLPVEASSDQLYRQRLGLDVVGASISLYVAVEHRLIQLHLTVDVHRVTDVHEASAVLAA